MREEANIVEQYADADTSGRIDILIKYYPNFLRLVEGYEQSLSYIIKQEKEYKGSILIELSGVLHTSPNYLLGMEEYEEDLLEIIIVYKNLKGSKTKEIAL